MKAQAAQTAHERRDLSTVTLGGTTPLGGTRAIRGDVRLALLTDGSPA